MSDLTTYRNQIDQIDHEIIKLLGQRFEVVRQVGEYKKLHNLPPLQPGRWADVLKNRTEFAESLNIDPNCIIDIWNRIHESALKIEQ